MRQFLAQCVYTTTTTAVTITDLGRDIEAGLGALYFHAVHASRHIARLP